MRLEENLKIFKALADQSRLKLVNCLMESPQYVQELSRRMDLSEPTISFHLKKLADAGLLDRKKEQYYVVYGLKEAAFKKSLKSMVEFRDFDRPDQENRVKDFRGKILKTYFQNGKLIKIPRQNKKKRVVFEAIARVFEPGISYPENRVNELIQLCHEDYCTIRRLMISEKILERNSGIYRLHPEYGADPESCGEVG